MINLRIGNICQGLEHLVVDLRRLKPVFLHVQPSGKAAVFFKIIFVLLPGVVILMHLKLASGKDDLDILLYDVMFFAVNVADHRGETVFLHKSPEIKYA